MLHTDDIQYVRDLGLVARNAPVRIANPIYREVIPRDLTLDRQETLLHDPAWYVDAAGNLLLTDLLAAFQEFFRGPSATGSSRPAPTWTVATPPRGTW